MHAAPRVPGCPAATDWMALATWVWTHAVRAVPRSVSRAWVDDLTAWHRGAPEDSRVAALAMWSATELFVRAAQLTINVAKSGTVWRQSTVLKGTNSQKGSLSIDFIW